MLILFAGIGDEMKTLVIVFGCIWPVLLSAGRESGVHLRSPHFRQPR
jgi:ABC-type nitrate/sulfonate/bicarbonate transport system permease component